MAGLNFWQRLQFALTNRLPGYGPGAYGYAGSRGGMGMNEGKARGAAYQLIPTWEDNKPSYTAPKFEAWTREGYSKNTLIYACIQLKAEACALPRLDVYEGTGDDMEELPNHPLVQLLRKPNPWYTGFDMLAGIMVDLDVAGRSYWQKIRNPLGGVVQLWRMRPDWVSVVKSSRDFISEYVYCPAGVNQTQAAHIKPQDVLDFRLFDPLNQYGELSPLQVLAREGDVDNNITDFVKSFFEHGGMPPGMLVSKVPLSDPEIAKARAEWRQRYGGSRNWLDPAVMDVDVTYQAIGNSFKDMQFGDVDARTETRICQALRVPPILVGAKIGIDRSTYSNYESAQRAFWYDVLKPQYRRIGDELNGDLAPEYGDCYLEWDYSDVPALQEDRTGQWTRATSAVGAGFVTVNEARAEVGLPAVAGGDVFLRQPTVLTVPVLGEGMATLGPQPTQAQATETGGGTSEEQVAGANENVGEEGTEEVAQGKSDPRPPLNGKAKAGAALPAPARPKPLTAAERAQQRAKRERAMQEAMGRYLEAQRARLVADVRASGNGAGGNGTGGAA